MMSNVREDHAAESPGMNLFMWVEALSESGAARVAQHPRFVSHGGCLYSYTLCCTSKAPH